LALADLLVLAWTVRGTATSPTQSKIPFLTLTILLAEHLVSKLLTKQRSGKCL